jgi:hypothetical protein
MVLVSGQMKENVMAKTKPPKPHYDIENEEWVNWVPTPEQKAWVESPAFRAGRENYLRVCRSLPPGVKHGAPD